MTLIQEEKFKRKDLKKTADVVTIWLNKEDRQILEKTKHIIEQEKDGTALKQMAFIGAKLLGSEQMQHTLSLIYSNKRKNKRQGIAEFD